MGPLNLRLGIVGTALFKLKHPEKLFSDDDDPRKKELREAFTFGYSYGYVDNGNLYDPNARFEEFYQKYANKGENKE